MMNHTRYARSLLSLALVASAAVLLSACGGGGSSGGKGKSHIAGNDLVLKKFMLVNEDDEPLGGTGTTEARRDVRLLFVFTAPIRMSSVTSRTIRIGIPTGNGLFLEAPGRFEPVIDLGRDGRVGGGDDRRVRNQVRFNPTATRDDTDIADNPFGLDGNALYLVEIPSIDDQESFVQTEEGNGILTPFAASFTTGDGYLPNLEQPELLSTTPADAEFGVSATSDIALNFTAPMKPDSFDLGSSVIVRNLTTGRDVLGQIRFSADAKTVTFRPVVGYGRGPYDIFVRVTTVVTNLAGNPIPKEVRFTFTTALDITQPEFESVEEEFDQNAFEDTTYGPTLPPAAWNFGTTAGLLSGRFTSGTITLSKGQNFSPITYLYPPYAWGQNFQTQFQTMFTSQEMGGARTITGYDWYYRALAASTKTGVTMRLGHTKAGSLGTNFGNNYSDAPVTVVNNAASYNIPAAPSEGWLAAPNFAQPWKYNGSDNAVLEVLNTNGANGQNMAPANAAWTGLWRIAQNEPFNRTVYNQPASVGGGVVLQRYHMDTRFNFLTAESEAQSLWYDTGLRSPQYLDAILFPDVGSQPAGTVSTFLFQGAPEDPDTLGKPKVDQATDWISDLTSLTGYRFVRFHAEFRGNESTLKQPAYERLIFPFIFFVN